MTMFHHSHLIFLPLLIMSTIIALSSTSWLIMWLSLEMNLISFIPMISYPKNQFFTKSAMKYFLIQSSSSITFLFLTIFLASLPSLLLKLQPIIMLVMIMKSGSAPFHHWFVTITNNISWFSLLLLLTWQKIIPFLIISLMNTWMILLLAILNLIIGSTSGISSPSTRLIMTYSSLSHQGWMYSSMMLSDSLWMFYLTIYSMNFILCLLPLSQMNNAFLNNFSTSYSSKISLFISLMNLAGMPPLPGFIPKWVILEMIPPHLIFLSLILITSATISIFFYMQMTNPALTLSAYNKPLMKSSLLIKIILYPYILMFLPLLFL
uniref:NADH-ubiquinone oxidoreductase chain 2 n=1 Tax=Armillifer agkistrodontis TaxID=592791 RepID=A0A1J0CYI3_ARMAG|nr:NADH dehydrogenase subunit 2 [Armillifer agkistrodontis]APB92065.1 NADH dehydrogenase subunit 2 [Armillifer agkistrodontis]